jgi:lysophospholipase L1-like esterase
MIKIKDNSKILFIGDSITDVKFNRRMNAKLHGKNIYPLQVSKELKKRANNLKFFYKGIASDRTYLVYDRLTKDCISLKPDIIVMLIGVNDAWEHYVPEQYPPLRRPMKEHMQEIYRRINTELDDVQLLVLLPFMIDTVEEKLPFHKILDEYREELRKMAEENSAEIIDLQLEFYEAQKKIEPKKLATDGIHPTNLGHKVIADAVLDKIEIIK